MWQVRTPPGLHLKAGFSIAPISAPLVNSLQAFQSTVRSASRAFSGTFIQVDVAVFTQGVMKRIPIPAGLIQGPLHRLKEFIDATLSVDPENLGSGSLIAVGEPSPLPEYTIFEMWFSRIDFADFGRIVSAPRNPFRLMVSRPIGRTALNAPLRLSNTRPIPNSLLGTKPTYIKPGIPWPIQAADNSHLPFEYKDDGLCFQRVCDALQVTNSPPQLKTTAELLEWLTLQYKVVSGKDLVTIHPYLDADKYYVSDDPPRGYDNPPILPLVKRSRLFPKLVFHYHPHNIQPVDLSETTYILYDGKKHVAMPLYHTCEVDQEFPRWKLTENFVQGRGNLFYLHPRNQDAALLPALVPVPSSFNRPAATNSFKLVNPEWSIVSAYPWQDQVFKESRKPKETDQIGYLFFDFETVNNAQYKTVPYAVSWLLVTVDPETFTPISPATPQEFVNATQFYYGENAAEHILLSILSASFTSENRHRYSQIVGVTFNGSSFDNALLFDAANSIRKETLDPTFYGSFSIQRPFIQGSALSDFYIDGYFSLFDLRRHLSGSLAANCKAFNTEIVKVGDFNHDAVQSVFNEGGFDHLRSYAGPLLLPAGKTPEDYPDGNFPAFIDKLEEYAKVDSACLADLFFKYRAVQIFGPHTQFKPRMTLASETFSAWETYMKQNHAPPETEPSKKRPRSLTDKILYLWDPLPISFIQELRSASVVAGRVQLFHPPTWYKEPCVSMDVKSLYPYVMCVKDVYYPHGSFEITKEFHYEEQGLELYHTSEKRGKLGLWKVHVDQSHLPSKNLPYILAVKYETEDAEFYDMLNTPPPKVEKNNWQSPYVPNLWITSEEMRVLLKYDCHVIVQEACVWEDRIRSIDLFGNLAKLMQIKNAEDRKKELKQPFNSALRQAAKLASNALYGKMMEGFHEDTVEAIDRQRYDTITDDLANGKSRYSKLSVLHPFGKQVFAKLTRVVSEELFGQKQRPLVIGFYILAYARMYMYEYAYAKLGLDKCYYTDTDAIKTSRAAYEQRLKPFWEKTKIPHWPDAEEFEPLYASEHIYEEACKCYGGFEDEFKDIQDGRNGGLITISKKCWLMLPEGVTHLREGTQEPFTYPKVNYADCKIGTKGVALRDALLSNNFLARYYALPAKLTGDQFREFCADAFHDPSNTVRDNILELFARLLLDSRAVVVHSNFVKHLVQLSHNVTWDQSEKHVKHFGSMSQRYSISILSPHLNQEVRSEILY